MAVLALVTAGRVRLVESIEQLTLPTNEAVVAGQLVRIDTSTGKFTKGNGTTTGEARIYGVALASVPSGFPVTAIRHGIIDGYNLDSQAYDAALYASDTDGMPGDAAGTVSKVVGRVIPVFDNLLGVAADKLFHVDINN